MLPSPNSRVISRGQKPLGKYDIRYNLKDDFLFGQVVVVDHFQRQHRLEQDAGDANKTGNTQQPLDHGCQLGGKDGSDTGRVTHDSPNMYQDKRVSSLKSGGLLVMKMQTAHSVQHVVLFGQTPGSGQGPVHTRRRSRFEYNFAFKSL